MCLLSSNIGEIGLLVGATLAGWPLLLTAVLVLYVNLAILWECMLLLVIVYLPSLHTSFGTYALTMNDWLIILLMTSTVIPILELCKWLVRHNVLGEID